MPDLSLPLDMLVSAMIRTAARDNVPIVVRRRGDDTNGTLIVKINLLNGMAKVYSQIRYGDDLVWCAPTAADTMPDADAERHMESQAAIDPDSWLVEIEDKQGRLWFPGRILKL